MLKKFRNFSGFDKWSGNIGQSVARSAEPKSDKYCGKSVFTDVGANIFAYLRPDFRKLKNAGQFPAWNGDINVWNQKAEKRQSAHKIDDPKKSSENQTVRPARAMLEKRLIRKPQKAKNSPARILLAHSIQIGTEHQSAEKKRKSYDWSQWNAFRNFPADGKNRGDKQKCDGIVRFSWRHRSILDLGQAGFGFKFPPSYCNWISSDFKYELIIGFSDRNIGFFFAENFAPFAVKNFSPP